MRILFLNPASGLGGAERCLLDLQASIAEADPEVEMHLAVGGPGPLVAAAERLGVRVHIVPMPRVLAATGEGGSMSPLLLIDALFGGVSAIGYCRRIRDLARRISPDVVHSNGVKCHIISAMARLGVPVVWHIRDLVGRRRLVGRVLRHYATRASGAIAVSRLVERDARAVLGNLRIDVVYDAIDTDAFSPGPGDGIALDVAAGFAPVEGPVIRIGLIAAYARWKGQGVFLDAITRVPEAPDGAIVRYFIVGGPIYDTRGSQFTEAELRTRVGRLGIAQRVGFVPFRNDIVEVYRSLDIVVHASTQPEPFGRTIAEAMACGRTLVLSETTGASEILRPSLRGLAFHAGHAESLAAAIGSLLDSHATQSHCAEARAAAVEAFSRPRLGARLLALYRDLTARLPVAGPVE